MLKKSIEYIDTIYNLSKIKSCINCLKSDNSYNIEYNNINIHYNHDTDKLYLDDKLIDSDNEKDRDFFISKFDIDDIMKLKDIVLNKEKKGCLLEM